MNSTNPGLDLHEIGNTYVTPKDRFVVSLVVGYGTIDDGIHSPEEAARAALDLTQDLGCSGTQWYVYDRHTGVMHMIEQSAFMDDDLFDLHTHLAEIVASPTDLVLAHLKVGHGVEPDVVDEGQEVERHMREHSVACPDCTYRAVDETDLAEHQHYNHKEK